MQLNNEHEVFAWLIIIGAICLTIVIGAFLDKFMHSRRQSNLRVETKAVRVNAVTPARRRYPRNR